MLPQLADSPAPASAAIVLAIGLMQPPAWLAVVLLLPIWLRAMVAAWNDWTTRERKNKQ